MRTLSLASLLAAAVAACTPYNPELGEAPFFCGPPEQDPRCPEGYTCIPAPGGGTMDVCVSPNGTIPPDSNGLAGCDDDSSLEPNDSYMNAWITPVDQTKNFPLSSLSICPSGDKDTYSVMLTTPNQNLEMTVRYEAGGAALQGALLNSGGSPIMNASPVVGMSQTIRAYVANMPTGVYYVQVYGPNSGTVTTNNYELDIVVTGP